MQQRRRRADGPAALPADVLGLVLDNLGYVSIARCAQVCRSWRVAASSNAVWDHACESVWRDKVFVCEQAIALRRGKQARRAFVVALQDSRRMWLTKEELCGFTWHARAKGGIKENDPWWKGEPVPTIGFREDGEMDVTQLIARGLFPPGAQMDWRFVDFAFGQKCTHHGQFVRGGLKIGQQTRLLPALRVERFAQNWGFILHCAMVVYTSFPMPRRGEVPELEDEALEDVSLLQQTELSAVEQVTDTQPPLPEPQPRSRHGPEEGVEEGEGEGEEEDFRAPLPSLRFDADGLPFVVDS